jgi:ABC-type multidrug transport system fused ATPase/permease subunit
MTGGQVLNVFFAIVLGAYAVGQATPYLAVIGKAQGAAQKVFETIESKSPIDPLSDKGEKLKKVTGTVSFKNIHFNYPSRMDVPILEDFNLEIKSGQTVALVGSSGSGKSTIVKLVERFYNPVKGQVLLDGQDISSLNVTWLRQQIGVVSQEVCFFSKRPWLYD